MIFKETGLEGVFLITPEVHEDERGLFARTWCRREFEENGLDPRLVQCNTSYNVKKGTLRGMHYQAFPHQEVKLVRCTRGSIFDVALDLRPDSPTFRRWEGHHLTADNRNMLYIPGGFAHGFITLEPGSEVFYQMSQYYHEESARGFRYDDPAFGIRWPVEVALISDRDRSHPDFESMVE